MGREENEKKNIEKTSQFLKTVESMQSKYQEEKTTMSSGYEKKLETLNSKCDSLEEKVNELNLQLQEKIKDIEDCRSQLKQLELEKDNEEKILKKEIDIM